MTSNPTPQLWRWMMLCAAIAGVGGAAILAAPGLADTDDVLDFSVHLPLIARSEESTPPPIPPTAAPPPTVEPTVEPTPPPAVCSCHANIYNCADFSTHAQAQACYLHCIAEGAGDVHQLDADNDGIACEALP